MLSVLNLTVLHIIRNVTVLHAAQNTHSALCSLFFVLDDKSSCLMTTTVWKTICLVACARQQNRDMTGAVSREKSWAEHACLMSGFSQNRLQFLQFFPLLNSVWLSVLVVICCVCVGQGVQGPPGLQGIQGKPGPQVSLCCDEQNFAYMQTWRNNDRVTPLHVLLIK